MGPHDASDAFVFELETFLKKKENELLKISSLSTQGHRGVSFNTSIRHERNAFFDHFDKNCKETQKINGR